MYSGVVVIAALAALGAADRAAEGQRLDPQRITVAQAERPLVSGERVRVNKLTSDMESSMQTLNQGGVKPFQDPAYVEKWRQAIERYRNALKKYPQIDDPDVKAAIAKLGELTNMVAFGINEAAKQKGELGDVQTILASIERNLRSYPPPGWLPAPFGEEEARAWLTRAADAQQTAKKSLAELQRIAPSAHLPINRGTVQQGAPYDKQDLDRLANFANSVFNDVGEAVQQTATTLKHQFEVQDGDLDYYRELDPENEQDRMNAFLMEGAEEKIYGGLDKQLALAQSVVAYQRVFGREPSAVSIARIDEIVALRKTYADHRQRALGDSTLPETKSSDAERIAVAEQILAEPRYQYGQHGPIVLTTKAIVEREKQVSRAQIKEFDVSLSGDLTLSGTETTWTYKWQEFKFATPLKETDSDDWYIWWVVAKKFSSGSEGTPIGEWVSGAATKGDRILEKNF